MPSTYASRRKQHHDHVTGPCRFIPMAVDCDAYSACSRCGWNPDVERERKAKLRVKPPPVKKEPVLFILGGGTFE